MTIWRVRIAHWRIKATETHSEYVILNPVEKYCRAGQATDDNMAHAHFMLDI